MKSIKKGVSTMNEIEAKKKDYEVHSEAIQMALSINDLVSAYSNYLICSQLADEISKLTLDKKDSEDYAKKSEDCHKLANDILPKLHLSKDEEEKLNKKKMPKGFDQFIGEDKLKDYLKKEVIEPWRKHELNQRDKNIILIYGPEGVSKKVLIQSLIHELQATPYYINPINNYSPYSENVVDSFKKLFKMAEEKDNVVFYFTRPVCFFPEPNNKESKMTSKIFTKLLKKELKRIKKKNLNILFVASTSAMDKMDKKVFKKGLFDDLLRVHHPDRSTRKGMMEERLKDVEFEDKDMIDKLTPVTHGFVSKEISRLCRRIISTSKLYQKDGKNAVITNEMMKRIMHDLGPLDDIDFKNVVDDFEKALPAGVSIVNDNHD